MKKMAIYSLLFLFALSCSNDIQLNSEWKSIPIVYGLLNTADTAQYLRVEKAFVDESTSALELAQRADSLYFDNAEVRIINDETGDSYLLEKVDGNLEGYVRDTGVFAQAPNYLYKIKTDVLFPGDPNDYGGDVFSLSIKRNEDLPLITAQTIVVEEPTIGSPAPGTTKITFRPTKETTISWLQNEEASIFDLRMRLSYLEVKGGMSTEKFLMWNVARNIFDEKSVTIQGEEFFEFLASNIEEDEDAQRLFLDVEIILDSGGNEITEYIKVGQANLGITSSQDIPVFTNLSEGRGLFSSRHRYEREPVQLSPITKDSLVNGAITKHLNF